MDVPLVLLRDTATIGGASLRCAVEPNLSGQVHTVQVAGVGRVRAGTVLVCRAGQVPARLAEVTSPVAGVVGAVSVFDSVGPWMRHAKVWITSREDVTGSLPDEVVFYPTVSAVDAYGTARRGPSAAGLAAVAGRVEPVSSREDARDGQRREQQWTVTVDGDLAGSGVDAYSTMTCSGVTYQLVGDPLIHADGVGGSYSTATLRRVGPGTA